MGDAGGLVQFGRRFNSFQFLSQDTKTKFYTMDAFEEQTDPAADFLAREQAELGEELGEELGISNAPPVIAHMEGLSLEDQQELEAVNHEVAQERTTTPSPAFVMPPRPKEEPETIRQWREEQAKRFEENLNKTKESNREDEKEFVFNDISPGTEWERVTKLCDFSGKNANKNSTKDMSRMKSILINLKAQEMNGDKNAS